MIGSMILSLALVSAPPPAPPNDYPPRPVQVEADLRPLLSPYSGYHATDCRFGGCGVFADREPLRNAVRFVAGPPYPVITFLRNREPLRKIGRVFCRRCRG